jgi:hypothetical protein
MEALNPWRMRVIAALRKYPDELREPATRMAVDARKDPATSSGVIPMAPPYAGPRCRRTADSKV